MPIWCCRELAVQFHFLHAECLNEMKENATRIKEMGSGGGVEAMTAQLSFQFSALQHHRPHSSQPTSFPHCYKAARLTKPGLNPNVWLKPHPNPILSGPGIFKHRHCTEQSSSTAASPLRRAVLLCLSTIQWFHAILYKACSYRIQEPCTNLSAIMSIKTAFK